MVTYCCDRCKKAIEDDDVEAIEVKQMAYKMLFSLKDEEFKPIRQNPVKKIEETNNLPTGSVIILNFQLFDNV